MNRETIDGDTRYRQEFKDRVEAGRGYVVCLEFSITTLTSSTLIDVPHRSWSRASTLVTPGVSRGHTGAVLQDSLMPGTSSSLGSRTVSTSVSINVYKNNSKLDDHETSQTLARPSFPDSPRPSTSRATIGNSYQAHDVDGSLLLDDSIDSCAENPQRRRGDGVATASHFGSASRGRSEQEEVHLDDTVNPRCRSGDNRLAHHQGTPSMMTVFQSVLPKQDKLEPDLKPSPHLTTTTTKAQKKSRIANMKGRKTTNPRPLSTNASY
jgi:hypothetical protein